MKRLIQYIKTKFGSIFANLGFKWKFTVTYTPVICIIILTISLTTYNISMNRMKKDETDLMVSHLSNLRMFIDANLGMYSKKSEILFNNTYLQEALLTQYESGVGNSVYALQGLYKLIDPVFEDMYVIGENATPRDTLDSGIPRILIYTNNPTIPINIALTNDLESVIDEPWVKSLYAKPGLIAWEGFSKTGNKQFFSLNRVLKDFKTNKQLGILSIQIPVSKLIYLLGEGYQYPMFDFYLADNSGKIVPLTNQDNVELPGNMIDVYKNNTNTDNSWIQSINNGSGNFLIANETLQSNNFHLVGIASYEMIRSRLAPIRYMTIWVLFAGIGMSILIGFVVAKFLSRRLEKFQRKMTALMGNNTLMIDPIDGNDEIGVMDRNFDNLICMLRESYKNEEHHMHNRTALQMELLQARINPHLLYNTMAAISWNSKKSGHDEVYKISNELIRFYKHFLNHGLIISKVSDEISMIENYINIMKFTYNIQFDVKMLISDDVNALYCPNLFLQPIVENAIVHGIRTKDQPGGNLTIRGYEESGKLKFVISDDGVGMTSERIQEVLENKEAATGYGLSNIRRRLEFYYRSEFEIKISSEVGTGCEVRISIPILPFEQLDVLIRLEE